MSNVIQMEDWKKARDEHRAEDDAHEEVSKLLSNCYVLRQRLTSLSVKEAFVLWSDIVDKMKLAQEIASKHGISITYHTNGTHSIGRYIKQGVGDD